jgi:hypothetical protein
MARAIDALSGHGMRSTRRLLGADVRTPTAGSSSDLVERVFGDRCINSGRERREIDRQDTALSDSASPFGAHLWRWSIASIKAAGLVLQLIAPKCAVCWSSYLGLASSTLAAALRLNPAWSFSSLAISSLTLAIMLLQAVRGRRYGPASLAAVAYLLLTSGWLADLPPVQDGGLILLMAAFAGEGSTFRQICRSRAAQMPKLSHLCSRIQALTRVLLGLSQRFSKGPSWPHGRISLFSRRSDQDRRHPSITR